MSVNNVLGVSRSLPIFNYGINLQTVTTHPPIVLCLDLSDINSLQTEVDKVLAVHGRIDILINNAGISYRGEVVDTNVNVDIKVMLINYFAQIALSKGELNN